MQNRVKDVVVVGAGPYGLSAIAHLRAAGRDAAIFGDPMSFWERNMPKGMLLRSPYPACNIDAPGALTLDDFARATGVTVTRPVPLSRFVEFGHWIARQVADDVDERSVEMIDRDGDGFTVRLADGETFRARAVVVAAGIARFSWRPPEFRELPPCVLSHTVEEPDLLRFTGHRVAVVGAGQSALESAALLCEAGAEPVVLARRRIRFVLRRGPLHWGPMRLLHHPYEIGPGGLSHLVTYPGAFTQIPRPLQDKLAARAIRPVGAAWLEPRLRAVQHIEQSHVREAGCAPDGRARLRLADGSTHVFDHVLLATGYRIDIARYGFLSDRLLGSIRRVHGYPVLNRGLESSVPGLHFVGAPSAWSCGPLVRFVAGTQFTARRLVPGLGSARGWHRAPAAPVPAAARLG